MRFFKFAIATVALSLLLAGSASAADRGTPDDAKVLAEKAAAHFKDVGADKAIADFMNPQGGYVDRDLFVVVYDPTGKIMSGMIPVLIGKNATELKDTDGKEFGKEIMAKAKAEKMGWVEYRMTNPSTKKIEAKVSYVVQVGDYVVFVGAYKS
jgi:cytochrome c